MNRFLKSKMLLALVGAILLSVFGYRHVMSGQIFASNPGDRIGKVIRENLVQRVTIAGSAESLRTTIVMAPYDGYVKKLFAKLGAKVQTGEPIVSVAQSLLASENVFPIRAPFPGVVTQLMKMEGQYVKQGDSKDFILRIDDLSKMNIHANAPEIDVVKIQMGFEAVIKVSAILSRSYRGIVRDISLAATPKETWGGRSQVEYLVKIEVLDAGAELKPGMSAVVDIITNKKDGVLSLGHEFIQKENDAFFVQMKDGTRRDIKVGLQNETSFEILEGLQEGDEIRQIDFLKLIQAD